MLDVRQAERNFYSALNHPPKRKRKKKGGVGGKLLLQTLSVGVMTTTKTNNTHTFADVAKRAIIHQAFKFDDSPETEIYNDGDNDSDSVLTLGNVSMVSQVSMMSACHLSTNVILARAMTRLEKRIEVNEQKKQIIANDRQKLLSRLNEKKSRPARLKLERRKISAIQTWLSVIQIVNNKHIWEANFRRRVKFLKTCKQKHQSAIFLQRELKTLLSNKLWKKHTEFWARVYRSRWVYELAVRCWRRRTSVDKIATFLRERADMSTISIMVAKFLKSVRKVQKFVRAFLDCNRVRMSILSGMWNEVEVKFESLLTARMKEAKRMKPVLVDKTSDLSRVLLSEYNNTVKAWQERNDAFEELMQGQRRKKHVANNLIASLHLVLSKQDRITVLAKMLRTARNNHVKNITLCIQRINSERKKRALSRFDVSDVTKVLMLGDMTGEVPKQPEQIEDDNLRPFFLFWSALKEQQTIDQLFNVTYNDNKFGDPIEANQKSLNSRKGLAVVAVPKVQKRRYAVSIEKFVTSSPAKISSSKTDVMFSIRAESQKKTEDLENSKKAVMKRRKREKSEGQSSGNTLYRV